MEQYIDIAEQAFAEQIQKINDIWQRAEPGSGEEFAANLVEKVLSYMEETVAKQWNVSETNDVLNMLVPALNEIREKIKTNNQ